MNEPTKSPRPTKAWIVGATVVSWKDEGDNFHIKPVITVAKDGKQLELELPVQRRKHLHWNSHDGQALCGCRIGARRLVGGRVEFGWPSHHVSRARKDDCEECRKKLQETGD